MARGTRGLGNRSAFVLGRTRRTESEEAWILTFGLLLTSGVLLQFWASASLPTKR